MARSKKVKTPTAEITRRATKGTSELQQKASLNYTKNGNLYRIIEGMSTRTTSDGPVGPEAFHSSFDDD